MRCKAGSLRRDRHLPLPPASAASPGPPPPGCQLTATTMSSGALVTDCPRVPGACV